jgi:hypothetical protein
MKKLTLTEKKERAAILGKEIEKLLPVVNKYNALNTERYQLVQDIKVTEDRNEYYNIVSKCEYNEPDYPGMGYAGTNGSTIFETQELANKLINTLNKASYAFNFLVWTGPGRYTIQPTCEYTSWDNDYRNVATFIKDET